MNPPYAPYPSDFYNMLGISDNGLFYMADILWELFLDGTIDTEDEYNKLLNSIFEE